jgi:hypothetical protein
MHGYIKTSEEVARIASGIYAGARNAGEIAVLYRLLHDMKEKQGMPGVYFHPVIGGTLSAGGPEYAQHRACGKVLSGVFTAVCNRGQLQVSKSPSGTRRRNAVTKYLPIPQNIVKLPATSPPTASWTLRRMAAQRLSCA